MSHQGYGGHGPSEGQAHDPYAHDPNAQPVPPQGQAGYGQTAYGQQPQPYGQPSQFSGQQPYGYPQQGYSPYGVQPYQRPAWKVVVAVLCFIVGGILALLVLLGLIGSLAQGAPEGTDAGGYMIGVVIGFVFFMAIAGLLGFVGYRLMRKPKQYG